MPETQANGITIHYEDRGNLDDPAILLIMGIGGQMTLWPDELLEGLVARGFRVIRYDNRDYGLSQKFDGFAVPRSDEIVAAFALGGKPAIPYSLGDMADDGAGLLDSLGVIAAHIVGVSMGAMIVQHLAARHPNKALSLTSFSSTTGANDLSRPNDAAARALTRQPASYEEDALVEHGLVAAQAIGSPAYPAPEHRLRERLRADFRRSFYPEGPRRHRAAIVADGDRTTMLQRLAIPVLVIHGEDDPVFPIDHARATADAIPGATMKTFAGLGHDLPLELVEAVTNAIADHCTAAGSRTS